MKTLSKYEQELYVSLGSKLDVERFFQYSSNEKIEEMAKPRDFLYYQAMNLKEASELCKVFIKYFNLGSSSWIGGRVVDKVGSFVAFISYNGRIWESEQYPCKEIIL